MPTPLQPSADEPTGVVLDCDPGHDDAVALLLALAADEVDLRAVTTVAGNHTIDNVTRNARRLLTLADHTDVPLARGAARPLVRDQVIADHVHGETGLDGADLPAPAIEPIEDHAVDVIIEEAHRGGLTLVPVGPLTNVALALRTAPDIVDGIDRIVLMGGAVADGNITPAAEFNVFADPEAARIVFEADVRVTMVGLDVTRAARIGPDHIQAIRDMGSPVATAVADLFGFYVGFHQEQYGWDDVPVHDACAIAEVIEPGIVETQPRHVVVETVGDHTYGRTVVDIRRVTDELPNTDVGLDIDQERFFERLFSGLRAYE